MKESEYSIFGEISIFEAVRQNDRREDEYIYKLVCTIYFYDSKQTCYN